MSITINCAVDSGYGYSLGQSGIKEVIISNFIKRIDKEDALVLATKINSLNEKGLIINYKNEYFVMGNLAVKADPSVKRHSINNRVNNIYHLIEILSTLGMLCDSKSFDVNLVVGLPNKLKDDKKSMTEWLKNKWEFKYITKDGEIERIIDVKNVAAIEQPVGAIYNLSQDDLEDLNVISCDVGHATTDCCLMTNGILSINDKDWIAIEGVKKCYGSLKEKLIKEFKDEYGVYDVLEKDLQLAIETGVFKIGKQNKDITNILNKILDDYAEYIALEISEKYSNYLVNADYIIGSGGLMNNDYFASALTKNLISNKVQLAFFDDPQKSIVHGMFNIANSIFDDDFNTENENNKENDVVDNG
ncbi:hypothetical protein K144316041_p20050 (plasmid) [Clostridium tetani]|uniref:ParM/StbA family protein n=1 Tax=Clostridium tetani TaxID=1513 RepID=UPI002954888E|nr:ParM/StbA family protein [Clostridium tetani]BDR74166.1 hypothetical protein K144316041_p20050 [Clostridium tetani]